MNGTPTHTVCVYVHIVHSDSNVTCYLCQVHNYMLALVSLYILIIHVFLSCCGYKDQMRGRNFTFWEWFYKHLDLVKTTLKREWVEG